MGRAVNHLYRPGGTVSRRRGDQQLFGGAGLVGRDTAAATWFFLCRRRIIISDHRRYTQRRRQTIGIEAAFIAAARRGISGNWRAARPTPTRTIGVSLNRCGHRLIDLRRRIGDDISLIAARLTLRSIVTGIVIARTGIPGAVIAPGIALTRAGIPVLIAVLITILIPTIGAVTTITVAVLAITGLTITRVAIARFPIAVTIAFTIAVAIATIIAAIGLIGIDPVISHAVAIAVEILVIAIVELVVRVAARLAFFKARAGFGKNAEIMIGKLQIIFGVDAVALHLRVTGQRFVFFKQLRRITARAIVDAIATFGPAPGIATTL